MLNPSVFKAYDVRGVYGVDWDADGAALVARAFVEKFGLKSVALGWDMRASSPAMVAAVEKILVDAGVRVIKIGEVTTPTLYFAVAHYADRDGGIMITASHNTGEWNGMKLCLGEGMPVGESSGLLDIKELALKGLFSHSVISGTVETVDAVEACLDYVVGLVPLAPEPISVVIDCGNGMEGATVKKLLSRLPHVQAHLMFADPDGSFPNHEANPLKESTLADLKREVRERGAAFGVAFDGDGDRVGFVDETGAMVGGDVMTALAAQALLKKHPGAKILYDLRSRSSVGRAITAAGGVPELCRVGHAFIKKQMRESGAFFAGELSCHFYAREFFSVESADYMMLLVLQLLQTTGQPLSVLARALYVEAHSGEINYHVVDRAAALDALEKNLGAGARDVLRLDGLTFTMDSWWCNVRPSNTEPLLRVNVEAATPEAVAQHLSEIEKIIGGTRASH